MKKKSQSALFSPPGWWTGNDFLFKGGLIILLIQHIRTSKKAKSIKFTTPNFFLEKPQLIPRVRLLA